MDISSASSSARAFFGLARTLRFVSSVARMVSSSAAVDSSCNSGDRLLAAASAAGGLVGVGLQLAALGLQFGNAFIQPLHFIEIPMFLTLKLHKLVTQTLILAVAGQNFLLLVDEVGGADRLLRCIRVGDQLLGKVFFCAASWPVKVRLSYRALISRSRVCSSVPMPMIRSRMSAFSLSDTSMKRADPAPAASMKALSSCWPPVLQLGDLVAVFRRHRFGLFLGASVDFVGVSKIAPDRLLTQRIVFPLFSLSPRSLAAANA